MSPSYLNPENPKARTAVTFESDGLKLAGHLYRPPNSKPGQKTPAIAMAGPMTSVKEETLPHYAVPLANAGYTVLTFDNRNFGESDGGVRQHLSTAEQVSDLKNALSYLRTRPDVDADRIGLVCVCLGAGYGLEVAAFDPGVKAAALIAGGYNISDTYFGFLGAGGLKDYFSALGAARLKQYATGERQHMPAIAGPPSYGPAAMPVQEAWEFYGRAQKLVAPNWKNQLTSASMESIIGWNVVGHAHLVAAPTLVVHGTTDVLLPPKYAQEVHDQLGGPKKLRWIETHNHVELYDQEPYVPMAVDETKRWLAEHLPVG